MGRGAALPPDWTPNTGPTRRPLEVGMEIRLPGGHVAPILKTSRAGATIAEPARSTTINGKSVTMPGRRITICLVSEVEYRKASRSSHPRTTQPKENTMASKKKSAPAPSEKTAKKPAAAPKPPAERTHSPLEVLGYPVSRLIAWFGANGASTDETVHALTELGADLKKIKSVAGGPRAYVAARISVGKRKRVDVLKPAEVSAADAERIVGIVKKFRAAQAAAAAKAEPATAKKAKSAKKATAKTKAAPKPKAKVAAPATKPKRKAPQPAPKAPAEPGDTTYVPIEEATAPDAQAES